MQNASGRGNRMGEECVLLTFPLIPDLYEFSIFGVNETENKIT